MNSILRSLSLTHPIIQAPMAGVQGAALAVAVCNAGALGSLPGAMLSIEALDSEMATIAIGTSGAFNVNFFCHTPPDREPTANAAWLELLAPYFDELRVTTSQVPSGAGRLPFTAENCEVIAKYKPPVVSFHFGLPAASLIQRIKAWGGQVWASATTVEEARWLQAHGADAIIAQGLEAGGHRGHFLSHDLSLQMGTFALLPQIVAAVNLPVIAAGGIANADGVRAVLSLGASAAQIGTAFMLCDEATTSALHRAALVGNTHTELTRLFTGRPARGIPNRVMRELGAMNPLAPKFPLATQAMGLLRAAAEKNGVSDFSPLWSGQNTSSCAAISAHEMVQRLTAPN